MFWPRSFLHDDGGGGGGGDDDDDMTKTWVAVRTKKKYGKEMAAELALSKLKGEKGRRNANEERSRRVWGQVWDGWIVAYEEEIN
ncbi:hypothetical protein GQ457_17G026110 [Hibiscus cannabinus]